MVAFAWWTEVKKQTRMKIEMYVYKHMVLATKKVFEEAALTQLV